MKIRNARNMINEIEDNEGNVLANQDQIAQHLANHFQKKFESAPVEIAAELLEVIPKVINEEDHRMLDFIPEEEEIKATIFDMDPESAPGPDGFSGVNVSIKLDISQAYDTVSWDLLIKVLKQYGFPNDWYEWLVTSFKSARVSVLVNGGPCGFFKVERGLRRGDPLSPILFVIMEDVLSRKISALVEKGKLQPMVTKKGIHPTHLFFTDDVFIFSNGGRKSILNFLQLLDTYQACSGQVINKVKSKLCVDGTTQHRRKMISELVNMELSKFPDKYLGVYLAPGKITSPMVWTIVELIQKKLAAWKGRLLSFQDRLILIKSVLCSIPIYNISVYKWPLSVIKVCEKLIRIFLWTGDGDVRKYETISWRRVCAPYEEGGHGIKRLEVVKKSLLMKMIWKIINSDEEWELFFSAKFKDRNGQWTCNWKQSSVWKGLKWAWNTLKKIFDGKWEIAQVFLFGLTLGLVVIPYLKKLVSQNMSKEHTRMKVQELIHDGSWCIPTELQQIIPKVNLPIISGGIDERVWIVGKDEKFSIYIAIEKIRHREAVLTWPKYIWKYFLHPSITSNIWKLQQAVYVDDEVMRSRGFEMVYVCCICFAEQDNMKHTLWECDFSVAVWDWLNRVFCFTKPNSLEDVCKASKNKSPLIRQIWMTTACATLRELWFQKNAKLFEEKKPNLNSYKSRIMQLVHEGGVE
ncbi:uncharacterized protein LOC113305660 [Papaver somniferum]|uniref:uncharacterized protein LOC113305660 n=1 Tax=Papaver somniferum TaxID=3469 RepID=UPI000E6F4DA9|nr:uncharacterized protein LOC113305660 [Papaver somniferum]